MPIIKILPHPELCADGKTISAQPGVQLCELLLESDIAIEHACEMSRACTTCHVVVREGFSSLEEASEDEEDLLDRAWGLTAVSRLSCQVKVGSADLTVEIPKYTINHARENH
jgi:ferredoxin, 2Fe-2S